MPEVFKYVKKLDILLDNLKKFCIFLVISLLICSSFPHISAITNSKIDSSDNYEKSDKLDIKGDDKGEWKTNYFCRIRVHVDGADIYPSYGLGIIKYAECKGKVFYCYISGINGTDKIESGKWLDLRVDYLLGYTYLWWQSWLSESYMGGFAFKCRYKVG